MDRTAWRDAHDESQSCKSGPLRQAMRRIGLDALQVASHCDPRLVSE